MATRYIRVRWRDDQRASEQEFTLDGVRIRIRANYNARTGRWYIDVRDTSDAQIVGPIALVPGVDLWQPFKHLPIPQGRLYLEDTQRDAPATLASMDVSALLKYDEVL